MLLGAYGNGTFANNCDFSYIMIDGKQFDKLWVTVDRIYSKLAHFVKTLSQPVDKEQANYAKWQEKMCKDVEQGFGILQSKFQLLTLKVEYWSIEDIVSVVDCCLLLHNWMVTVCLSCNELELSEWYDATGDNGKQNGDSGIDNGDRRDNGDRCKNGDIGTTGDSALCSEEQTAFRFKTFFFPLLLTLFDCREEAKGIL
jgi:hypothetical protein